MASATLKDPPSPAPSAYDEDVDAWTPAQAEALREGRLGLLDLANTARLPATCPYGLDEILHRDFP